MRKKKKRMQQVRRQKLALLLVILVILIAAVAVLRTISKIAARNREVETTITESMVTDVMEISELSTVEYTYNAVAEAYTEDQTEVRYYVAYDGIVKAGIDFSEVKIQIDNSAKKISILIPEVQIVDCYVDAGTFEYIFTQDKYDDPQTVPPEANKLCNQDLRKRADQEKEMLTLGRENAIAAIEGLIKPWVDEIDSEYVVEVK